MVTPGEKWTLRRAQWRRYRVGRVLMYAGLGLYLPVMIAFNLVFKALGWADDAMLWIAVPWMAACVVNGLWFTWFVCPECGKRFFTRGGNWIGPLNAWGSKCCHCGARPPA